jgi:hypothetical protein
MIEILKLKEGSYKLYDIDSRVGLNGSKCFSQFQCLHDEDSQRFYVWMGGMTIDKFTKTTFLNLVNFAEKAGAH